MISVYLCDDEEAVLHQLKTALEWKNLRGKLRHEGGLCRVCRGELLNAAVDGQPERLLSGRGFAGWEGTASSWAGSSAAGPPRHTDLHHQLWRPDLENLSIPSGGLRLYREGGIKPASAARCLEARPCPAWTSVTTRRACFPTGLGTRPVTSLQISCFWRLLPRPSMCFSIRQTMTGDVDQCAVGSAGSPSTNPRQKVVLRLRPPRSAAPRGRRAGLCFMS